MNRDEVVQVLSILKAAFPHSYQKMTKADANALIMLWERQFANEDPQAVGAAVDALIASRTAGYSPTIGEIKEQLHRLRTADSLDEAQAWALVEKACRRGLYNAREEFEKLPADVQAAVGGPEQLKAWALMDSDTVNSVVASNFRKSYQTAKAREKEMAMLPEVVKGYINEAAKNMAIEEPQKPKPPAAILPPKLERITAQPKAGTSQQKGYKPPNETEWEKRREAAITKLLGGQK